MHHHPVKCAYTEKDQCKRIQDEKIQINFNKARKNNIGNYPYYKKNARNGYKCRSFSVKQTPVVKKPEEQKEINIRIGIQQNKERPGKPFCHQDAVHYLYRQCCKTNKNEGIVRRIYLSKSYYPDYYSNTDA